MFNYDFCVQLSEYKESIKGHKKQKDGKMLCGDV